MPDIVDVGFGRVASPVAGAVGFAAAAVIRADDPALPGMRFGQRGEVGRIAGQAGQAEQGGAVAGSAVVVAVIEAQSVLGQEMPFRVSLSGHSPRPVVDIAAATGLAPAGVRREGV